MLPCGLRWSLRRLGCAFALAVWADAALGFLADGSIVRKRLVWSMCVLVVRILVERGLEMGYDCQFCVVFDFEGGEGSFLAHRHDTIPFVPLAGQKFEFPSEDGSFCAKALSAVWNVTHREFMVLLSQQDCAGDDEPQFYVDYIRSCGFYVQDDVLAGGNA